MNTDPAAGRRKLDGIAHNIHKDLLQALLVSHHILMLQLGNTGTQLQTLGRHLSMEHGHQTFNGV